MGLRTLLGLKRAPQIPLDLRQITLVLDVGAHHGEFARALRAQGYDGRIVSFEPLDAGYKRLAKACEGDPLWSCERLALGDRNGPASLNVARNEVSSSLLKAHGRSIEIEPRIQPVGTENIKVVRLDSVFDDYARPKETVFLKIDTQGYEQRVLQGAASILERVSFLQVEVGVVPAYDGAAGLSEMSKYLWTLGFRIDAIQPGWRDDRTGELLEVDLICRRNK